MGKIKLDVVCKRLITLLLLLLPLNYYLFNIVLEGIPLINFWKEIILIIVGIVILVQKLKKSEKIYVDINSLLIFMFSVILLVFVLLSENIGAALSISRVYIEPLLFFLIVRLIGFTKEELVKMLNIIIIEFGLISLFGIFQAFVLGDQFLMKLFKVDFLNYSFYIAGRFGILRVNSTFVYPNDFGFYATLILLIALVLYFNLELSFYGKVSSIITFIALLASVSRSSWLTLFVGTVLFIALNFKKILLWYKKIKISIILLIPVLIFFIFLFDYLVFDGIIYKQVYSSLHFSVSGKDPSAKGHLDAFTDGFNQLKGHIFQGLGLGSNGPRALDYFGDQANLNESSFYVMLFEVGIIGAITYFSLYTNIFMQNYRNKSTLNFSFLSVSTLFSFFFLPYVQNLEGMILVFVLLAMSYSKSDEMTN